METKEMSELDKEYKPVKISGKKEENSVQNADKFNAVRTLFMKKFSYEKRKRLQLRKTISLLAHL